MFVLLLQKISLRLLLDVIQFPLWWYSKGLVIAARQLGTRIAGASARLAPGLWLKNIFVPMFGQYSLEGRLTSFFVRGGNVILRSIGLFFVTCWYALLFVVQVLLPLFAAYMCILSFSALV